MLPTKENNYRVFLTEPEPNLKAEHKIKKWRQAKTKHIFRSWSRSGCNLAYYKTFFSAN